MNATRIVAFVVFSFAFGALTTASQQADSQQSLTKPLRLTAFAVTFQGRGGAGTVEIQIERWTNDEQRDALRAQLMENGPDGLLRALQKTPRVGFIRTPDSLGYDLRYARERTLSDGGRRIVIATDRPIGFWEAATQSRSVQYPFTVIEIRLNPKGEGEGKMSIATRITMEPDTHTIVLEDYAAQPVLLEKVSVEK